MHTSSVSDSLACQRSHRQKKYGVGRGCLLARVHVVGMMVGRLGRVVTGVCQLHSSSGHWEDLREVELGRDRWGFSGGTGR